MDGNAERKRIQAVIVLQKWYRNSITNRRRLKKNLDDFDEMFGLKEGVTKTIMICPKKVFDAAISFLDVFDMDRDRHRLTALCRHLTSSASCSENSYATLLFMDQYSKQFQNQMLRIVSLLVRYLPKLDAEKEDDSLWLIMALRVITFVLCETNLAAAKIDVNLATADLIREKAIIMNLFARDASLHLADIGIFSNLNAMVRKRYRCNKFCLTPTCIYGVVAITNRILTAHPDRRSIVDSYFSNILILPALALHIENTSSKMNLQNKDVFEAGTLEKILNSVDGRTRAIIEANHIDGNGILFAMANLIQLARIHVQFLNKKQLRVKFVNTICTLLDMCYELKKTRNKKRHSNHSFYHPLIGWFPDKCSWFESFDQIRIQVRYLWSTEVTDCLITENIRSAAKRHSQNTIATTSTWKMSFQNMWQNCRDVLSCKKNENTDNGLFVEEELIASACLMYKKAASTFGLLRLEILTALSLTNKVAFDLWMYFSTVRGLHVFDELLDQAAYDNRALQNNRGRMFDLFNASMTHYLTVVDDIDMYENCPVFKLSDYTDIGAFLNRFVYRSIRLQLFTEKADGCTEFFRATHNLLMMLYARDSRRSYAPRNHWLITEINVNGFMKDLHKGKPYAVFIKKKMPHVIPFQKRIELLRNFLRADKEKAIQESEIQNPSHPAIIWTRIRREFIVEDAMREFQLLSYLEIKKTMRIRFVNSAGAVEQGIDQTGIFKEFVEILLTRLFNPEMNLFSRTPDGLAYPSPRSWMERNHLEMMEFCGKLIAKAVYEGQVACVILASFLLRQLEAHSESAGRTVSHYSFVDDLASLDGQLYRNLMSIKRYEGDVSDLSLNFVATTDHFGKPKSHELLPGGATINVDNSNRIIYIHLMAHFYLHTQLKEQVRAFSRGFYSVLDKEALSMFSNPELQYLISGDDRPIDLADLRRSTRYYGGYHDNHRVILWFWHVLRNEFDERERRLLLKFVTSTSRAPLLGFGSLNPQFSIRCVDVENEVENTETVGSYLSGLFSSSSVGRNVYDQHLPTSATCFNLLKLPNYNKRVVLRDKLRYAINSHSGFELS